MKKVLVAGYFDPLHDGHLDHIMKAAALGDWLMIATHTDLCTRQVKGQCFTSLTFRHFVLQGILKEMGMPGAVISTDAASMAGLIRQFKPDIFAKGGDRTADNMPADEIAACNEVGCQIIYGIGDQLNSSSQIKAAIGGQT